VSAELQETLSRRSGEVALLEKTVARKNEHIEILLRKDRDGLAGEAAKKREVLEERLRRNIEAEGERKERSEGREVEETLAALRAQVEALVKKGKKAEEEVKGLAKENEKLKEDNYYLVQRLKNKK
jgi:hypothetical protein